MIYNFERDDLLNHTAFSGHRTPRFALRAKTIGDNIRIVSGFGMNMILGWLISKLLLGWFWVCVVSVADFGILDWRGGNSEILSWRGAVKRAFNECHSSSPKS